MHTDDDYRPLMAKFENYPAPAGPGPTPTPTPPGPTGVPEFNAMGLVALIHFFFLGKRKPVLKEKNNPKHQIPTRIEEGSKPNTFKNFPGFLFSMDTFLKKPQMERKDLNA